MQLVSYAQNSEDILLWRALKNIDKGFYIDVGANHPVDDSVTKLFYENGWSGINIEPVPEKLEQLKNDRIRDINLGSLVGTQRGIVNFYEIPEDTRLSTTDEETAKRHALDFGYSIKVHQRKFERLDDICRCYNTREIHFLKIDVEGCEGEVIASMDFNYVKPWIIVIESTLPCSDENADISWEVMLKSEGYEFVFFDGLSRYYISNIKFQLKRHFSYPAGIHDSYITRKQFLIEQNIRELNYELKALKEKYSSTLKMIKSSMSWKITKPLRKLHNFLLKIQGKPYFTD
jgi:FkbM family methyltransferase